VCLETNKEYFEHSLKQKQATFQSKLKDAYIRKIDQWKQSEMKEKEIE